MPSTRINIGAENGKHADPPRLPPHNRDAERALLGSMLRDNAIIPDVLTKVRAHDLYVFGHQAIFSAIAKLHLDGIGVDVVTVAQRLIAHAHLDDAGGPAYLMELYDAAPSAANHDAYARTILDKAGMRRLQRIAIDLERRCADPSQSFAELSADLESRLAEVEKPGAMGYRFEPMTTRDFVRADFRPEWGIRNVFVLGQPMVIGGAKKKPQDLDPD